MNFQKTTQSNAFPRSKLKIKYLKNRKADTSLKINHNYTLDHVQPISLQLSQHNNKYNRSLSYFSNRNVKPSTAPQRAFRQFKQSISNQGDNSYQNELERRMQSAIKQILTKEQQKLIFNKNTIPKQKWSQRNQLIYLKPHIKSQNRATSLSKVKSQLYKQIQHSALQQANYQIQKSQNKNVIIQYSTQYQKIQRYSFPSYEQQSLSSQQLKKYFSIGSENSVQEIVSKQKQNIRWNRKSMNVLKEKVKNRTKNSFYINKLKSIKAQHQLKSKKYKSLIQGKASGQQSIVLKE